LVEVKPEFKFILVVLPST